MALTAAAHPPPTLSPHPLIHASGLVRPHKLPGHAVAGAKPFRDAASATNKLVVKLSQTVARSASGGSSSALGFARRNAGPLVASASNAAEDDEIFARSEASFDGAESRLSTSGTSSQEPSQQIRDAAADGKEEEAEEERGFLKLRQARDWSMGVDAAPFNMNQRTLERDQARADRRQQSFLEYQALKKDLSNTTIAVAGAVDAYTFLTLSPQTAISYAIGALGSYLYLQLLYRHADAVSEDNVAEIFQRRKVKKIGIRSSDVQESVEKTLRGCGIALSSPRLVIPAALYSLWAFSIQYTGTSSDSFHLEVVPLMLGFFAYKAAALIQAYRDNKDLLLVISASEPDSSQ